MRQRTAWLWAEAMAEASTIAMRLRGISGTEMLSEERSSVYSDCRAINSPKSEWNPLQDDTKYSLAAEALWTRPWLNAGCNSSMCCVLLATLRLLFEPANERQ